MTTSKLTSLLDGYIDRGDGTILDLRTNLIWQQKTPRERHTWEQAKEYCESLTLGGYTDWRLPTKEELESLINKRYCPTIYPIFQCHKAFYWSSTSGAVNPAYAWLVFFDDGYVSYDGKFSADYVRAVRSGP